MGARDLGCPISEQSAGDQILSNLGNLSQEIPLAKRDGGDP
jgi:hypothetical protein